MKRKKTPGYVNRMRTRRAVGRGILKCVEIALCLGIVGGFGYKFLQYAEGSTDFLVRKVEIRGLDHLNEYDVLRASGISDRENILFFDSDAVEAQVQDMSYVFDCDVELRFPDTAILHIEERQPEATLMLNSHSFEIDREGVVLRRYDPHEMPLLPFLTSETDLEFAEVGDTIKNPGLVEALRLWRLFARSPMAERLTVSELAVLHTDDIRMYCDELSFELRWGRGRFEEQITRLSALWDTLDGLIDCQQYLDLRFDADLVCK